MGNASIKKSVQRVVKQMLCNHQYHINAMSFYGICFKCDTCGKEKRIAMENAPQTCLHWGYDWYHQNATDNPETMRLLMRQEIAPNNTVVLHADAIYTVTLIEKIGVQKDGNAQLTGYPDFGTRLTVGYFFDRDAVNKALEQARPDVAGIHFDYAVTERIEDGIRQQNECSDIAWLKYRFKKDRYCWIPQPPIVCPHNGFVMGV